MCLIEKLVTTLHLSVEERRALGAEVISRSEIADVILRTLTSSGRFPSGVVPWQPGSAVFEGHFLESLPGGTVRLWWQRNQAVNPTLLAEQIHIDFSAPRLAVDALIGREWKDGHIDGVPFADY